MGYDLHITRKPNWSDEEGPVIGEAEWRSLIEEDPQLSLDTEMQMKMSDGQYVFAAWNGEPGVLAFYAGEITAKNPERPLIAKMARIAVALNAQVQGDDGEVYGEDGQQLEEVSRLPPESRPSVWSRISQWLKTRGTSSSLPPGTPRFKSGQRVRDVFGTLATVIEADSKVHGGLGLVRVKFDDGREATRACMASGLEIVDDSASDQ